MFCCQRECWGCHSTPNFLCQPQRAGSSLFKPKDSPGCLAQCWAGQDPQKDRSPEVQQVPTTPTHSTNKHMPGTA